jgi:excisionase family DNA binding protein
MLTTREAAALIGCHPRHVALLCRRGVLPCARFGRDYAIRREDAEAYRAGPKDKGGRPRKDRAA